GEGINARTISMKLQHFTLIGATTRSGMLSGPMRDRFKMHEHLEFYTVEELAQIVRINARKLQTPIDDEAALELARRSPATPRGGAGRPRAASAGWGGPPPSPPGGAPGRIPLAAPQAPRAMAGGAGEGMETQDRRYLETLIGVFNGGPTGVEALAATMNLPADTLSDEVEPYLLREQFIVRSPRGRTATMKAYALLGRSPKIVPPPDGQRGLFEVGLDRLRGDRSLTAQLRPAQDRVHRPLRPQLARHH